MADLAAEARELGERFTKLLTDARRVYGDYARTDPQMQALITRQNTTVAVAVEGLLGAFLASGVVNHGVLEAPPFVTVQGFLEALLTVANPGELEQCLSRAKIAHEAITKAAEDAAKNNLSPDEAFRQALEQMGQIGDQKR